VYLSLLCTLLFVFGVCLAEERFQLSLQFCRKRGHVVGENGWWAKLVKDAGRLFAEVMSWSLPADRLEPDERGPGDGG